jgi:uncharacterized protein DUF6328
MNNSRWLQRNYIQVAKLKDKIENALNEARILMLGGQVLIGVNYRSFFEDDFKALSFFSKRLLAISLGGMLIGLGLLLAPAPYHTIVEHHRISDRFHELLSRVLAFALLPFALALGADLYVAADKSLGGPGGAIAGVLGLLTAIACWWGIEVVARIRAAGEFRPSILFDPAPLGTEEKRMSENPKLTEKVKEVLVEARMVLPGAQALLGFQFIIVLMHGFDVMPAVLKYIHFGSLAAIAVSTILLIMPAAYHRIIYGGEDSEKFVDQAAHLLLWAMGFLALGVSGDFLVVCYRVTNSMQLSLAVALVLLAFFYGLWFGWTTYRKAAGASR